MKRDQGGTFLSAIFVDYDNIYLSLKRKSEEAAKKFAKEASTWIKGIESGALITPTNGPGAEGTRRIVMNRCYGNPVPRRSSTDNSTDMSSFPFVRHHFLRAGCEIIDCPPLTAQLKNSSDIRMVMDLRDYLTHPTYFDEFVIMSGDADFTPVLHRLRAHARRTVIYANDYTAAPYTAISDGEIRESDLIKLLTEGRLTSADAPAELVAIDASAVTDGIRREIIGEVAAAVRAAASPVPLEVLADRAVRAVGHERTIGSGWAGAGGFRELLSQHLPDGLKLSGEPPYVVIDTVRHLLAPAEAPETRMERAALTAPKPIGQAPQQQAVPLQPVAQTTYSAAPPVREREIILRDAPARDIPPREIAARDVAQREILPRELQPQREARYAPAPAPAAQMQPAPSPIEHRQAPPPRQQVSAYAAQEPMTAPAAPIAPRARQQEAFAAPAPQAPAPQPAPPVQRVQEASSSNIQQSIARIHDACQAPPLAPPEYRVLFEVMAQEINENGLIGAQTIANIVQRAQERGIDIRRDDARFVLEVVSEADPWFEQGASANLFAGRFRNFVVARCRSQGLNLSADELDLIEAWFAGNGANVAPRAPAPQQTVQQAAPVYAPPARQPIQQQAAVEPRGWGMDEQQPIAQRPQQRAPIVEQSSEDFPRIVRTRLRG